MTVQKLPPRRNLNDDQYVRNVGLVVRVSVGLRLPFFFARKVPGAMMIVATFLLAGLLNPLKAPTGWWVCAKKKKTP
jgi:hypothetical protein